MQEISFCFFCIIQVLILLIMINGAPILARNFFQAKYNQPIDLGVNFIDGHPLFGSSKTWRGLFSAIIMGCLVSWLFGMGIWNGIKFAVLVMLGDLLASFSKRRLGFIESSRVRLFDTLPESMLPVLVLQKQLGLTLIDVICCIILFVIFEVLLSPILYRLHIRIRPY